MLSLLVYDDEGWILLHVGLHPISTTNKHTMVILHVHEHVYACVYVSMYVCTCMYVYYMYVCVCMYTMYLPIGSQSGLSGSSDTL